MNSTIARLWLADNLPIRDGLYRADGLTRAVRAGPSTPGGLALLEPFDLEAWLLANPEWHTTIITTIELPLPDGSGYLCCGEGSYGSEGFFARLDQLNMLVWVVYLEDSNPFVDAAIHGPHATVRSSSRLSVTVDLTSPEFGPT
ncbi:hypothetical protein [Micromonospora zamorensis]|uniref:hypothetical protein n=1 Tax=Micromonospora zamorensis TaxID=709883 RepID=UPI00081F92E3|nr:hypothetical protein [Micromonospora zamorensis]SCG37568.1 hypothetical protein GA0070619_0511 [Micromonospora zamorensis]